MKESRRKFSEEYKKQIVQEYLAGNRSAVEIAEAEGLVAGQIYCWKTQLENRKRLERIEEIQTEQHVSPGPARRIRELEEELEAYKAKVADQAMVIDLLKKVQPNSASEKRSSGYIETKRSLGLRNGRVK
jgi:transposase-like protein